MNGGISRETFEDMDTDSKLCVLFDFVTNMEKQISKNKVINSGMVFAGGFIGGWSAVWSGFHFGFFGG